MFCSQCGQQQIPGPASFFCSNCGQRFERGAEFHDGQGLPVAEAARRCGTGRLSPRQKGVRQGLMLMASAVLVVPLTVILGVVMLGLPVEFIPASAVACVAGGLLRILYAFMLQEGAASGDARFARAAVPQFVPASSANLKSPHRTSLEPPRPGMWKAPDTGELYGARSITENTTNLLRYPLPGARGRDSAEKN